jgi:hypothetical protein
VLARPGFPSVRPAPGDQFRRTCEGRPIAGVYGATASAAFPMASLAGGLADEKSSCWSRLGIDEEMGKSSDIRAAVIDDLTFDPDVDASDIRVAEMNGDVVLTGSVPSYPQYVQAAAVAARAAGVRCVRNDLQVALPPGDHRDDLTLAAMASDALTLGGSVPEGVEVTARTATSLSPDPCGPAPSAKRQK